MNKTLVKIREIAVNHGFKAKIVKGYNHWNPEVNAINNPSVQIYAKNTNKHWTKWFLFDSVRSVFVGNNTDQCNIWLCETRPDLTPDVLCDFFKKIEDITEAEEGIMRAFVDPEDWQEIADVRDAYADQRYTS